MKLPSDFYLGHALHCENWHVLRTAILLAYFAAYKAGICPSFQGGMLEGVAIFLENGAVSDGICMRRAEIEIRNALLYQYDSELVIPSHGSESGGRDGGVL